MNKTMTNGRNFKCCPKMYCTVVLLKICVIVTTVYVLLYFHFKSEDSEFAIREPIIRSLANWTRGYFERYFERFIRKNLTGVKVDGSKNKALRNNTKNGRATRVKKKNIRRDGKTKVIIFVGIISAPQLIFRRNALRRSWLKECKRKGIPCLFFTDSQDMHGNKLPLHIYVPLHQEQLLHGDLILAESPGGINFARRYLWILNWANARYKFKYFLRVDDDYFVCMNRLLLELPHRPRKKLYWGHVHCSPPGGIRVDEGFVIVSNDLAQTFLREQNKTLMCHPYGDQAMSMWINDISGVTYFGDPRVHHHLAARDHILQHYDDICGNFLAIHGSYPVEIEKFWVHSLSKGTKKKYPIAAITYPCGKRSKTYNYMSFGGMYNAKPKPCRENPTWNIAEFYRGRSGK